MEQQHPHILIEESAFSVAEEDREGPDGGAPPPGNRDNHLCLGGRVSSDLFGSCCPAHPSKTIVLLSRQGWSPTSPSSRPMPDALYPPNGSGLHHGNADGRHSQSIMLPEEADFEDRWRIVSQAANAKEQLAP